MKKFVIILITVGVTIGLLLFFYFFYPHVWGELIYPLNYKESIKANAASRNLPPNFIAALIYSESNFHADSVSGAGAVGLMQIMPGTGAGIAGELGETDYSPAKLYDPDTNIRYGTWYIKGLIDKYGGNEDLALAAYNAGVARADAWKDGRSALPYETVFYIQKVKNYEKEYDKVYGNWTSETAVKKPTPFYQGINNFGSFVKGLILGSK